ncbi:TPA: hypothetical protein ACYSB1_001476 [Citrobacter braakii]
MSYTYDPYWQQRIADRRVLASTLAGASSFATDNSALDMGIGRYGKVQNDVVDES